MILPLVKTLPVIPLRGIVGMPYALLSFDVGRTISLAAVEAATQVDGCLLLVAQRDPKQIKIEHKDLYEYGCVCRINKIIKLPADTTRIFVEGLARAHIEEFIDGDAYLSAKVTEIEDVPCPYNEAVTLR